MQLVRRSGGRDRRERAPRPDTGLDRLLLCAIQVYVPVRGYRGKWRALDNPLAHVDVRRRVGQRNACARVHGQEETDLRTNWMRQFTTQYWQLGRTALQHV